MNAKDYLKLHRTKYLLSDNQEIEVLHVLMEDYAKHVIKEHGEWQSINEDELDFEYKFHDKAKYCACGKEIESENSAVCIDCFNEMTFND